MKKQTLEIVTKEVAPIVKQAQALAITNAKTMASSAESLSKLNKARDWLIADYESVTDDIKAGLKKIDARFKPHIKVLKEAIDLIRTKQGEYQTEQLRIADQKAGEAADRMATEGASIETAVAEIEAIAKPEDKIVTASGSVGFRPKNTLLITNLSVIPDCYFDLNETKLLADLESGTTVLGAEIKIMQIPINRR